ncbi:hypothetical protein K525DRAFT_275661 [Schizophyllum commune Loenen D]|nr:hypothetical protein K525DRAFT_275661 [Schizophyllum commune Loenen D]
MSDMAIGSLDSHIDKTDSRVCLSRLHALGHRNVFATHYVIKASKGTSVGRAAFSVESIVGTLPVCDGKIISCASGHASHCRVLLDMDTDALKLLINSDLIHTEVLWSWITIHPRTPTYGDRNSANHISAATAGARLPWFNDLCASSSVWWEHLPLPPPLFVSCTVLAWVSRHSFAAAEQWTFDVDWDIRAQAIMVFCRVDTSSQSTRADRAGSV